MDKIFRLVRSEFTEESTIGTLLSPSGAELCHSLEDPVRSVKIYGKTAIPPGVFEMTNVFSWKFGRKMPRLNGVPFFDGVLIHSGNRSDDTDGCLLLGNKKGRNVIWESRTAFGNFYDLFSKMAEVGKIFIQVEGGVPAASWSQGAA